MLFEAGFVEMERCCVYLVLEVLMLRLYGIEWEWRLYGSDWNIGVAGQSLCMT